MTSKVELVASAVADGLDQRDVAKPFFTNAQWTADGTSLIASSSTNTISTFVLPSDLLHPHQEPQTLIPQSLTLLPERTNILAAAPYFSLSYPQTHTALISCRDHPIQLIHLLSDSTTHPQPSPPKPTRSQALASYKLIKPQTEEYIYPTSLLWPSPGTHFLTGSTNLLAQFDITRTGEGPIRRIPTLPPVDDHLHGTGVLSIRGTVSALSAQPDSGVDNGFGLIAAGTWTRWIGLYDLAANTRGGSCCTAAWSVALDAKRAALSASLTTQSGIQSSDKGGGGVTQTIWSPCGRYLLVNERQSNALLVYDIRVTGKLLGWLAGRDGQTHQRLMCDVYASGGGQQHSERGMASGHFEVWAGTDRGVAKVWENVGSSEGEILPSWEWSNSNEAADGVGSVALHPSGSVIATCTGSRPTSDLATSRREQSHDSCSDSSSTSSDGSYMETEEPSLRVWNLTTGEDAAGN